MKFAEFVAGQVLEAGPYALDEQAIVAFAREWDPQWFHADAKAASAGPWEGLIASGWQTCGVAMKLIVDNFLAGSESFGSPGLAYLKWPAPVRAGDALRLRADVLDVRRSEKKPELGILRWRWRLLNQLDSEVLDLEVTSLFKLTAND
ncbi:MAG TPA: MaoC family dehydratase [Casimicrobiaceae bacterium]|nr:MaoC family dehydratase [Casimicrobiaceae bacterium]